MKQLEADMNEYDKGFHSMKNKISLSKEEERDILFQLNRNIENQPRKKKVLFNWKPYFTLAGVFLLLIMLSVPIIQERMGSLSNNLTPEQVVEKYYEAYNNKDYDTYLDLGSEKWEKELEDALKRSGISQDEALKGWLRKWVPAEVIQIKDHGGTKNKTTVVAIVHYPSTLLSPETTNMTTYELIKEDGDWKINQVIDIKGI